MEKNLDSKLLEEIQKQFENISSEIDKELEQILKKLSK